MAYRLAIILAKDPDRRLSLARPVFATEAETMRYARYLKRREPGLFRDWKALEFPTSRVNAIYPEKGIGRFLWIMPEEEPESFTRDMD